jgi:hypothetical protein
MVLCYSRQIYVEFTVSQTMEHFLACHVNAFTAFGGVRARVMVDNLKSAVLQHSIGQEPVFKRKYQDLPAIMDSRLVPVESASPTKKDGSKTGSAMSRKTSSPVRSSLISWPWRQQSGSG